MLSLFAAVVIGYALVNLVDLVDFVDFDVFCPL
jgi:hypothetical protein